MYLLWELIIGAIAGWLAGKFWRGRGFGLLGDIIVGVLGSFVGGFVFGLLGISAFSLIGQLITATVGAILLLYLIRFIRRA